MDKKFILKFALRNLMLHKLRTVLTLLAIMIGISAIIFLVAFAFGLERIVTREVTEGDAFKLVDVGTGNSQVIKLDAHALESIRGASNVKDVQAIINVGAQAKNNDKTIDCAFHGVTTKYLQWSGIKLKEGKMFRDNSSNSDSNTKPEIVTNAAFTNSLGSPDPKKLIGKEIAFDIIISKNLTENSEVKTQENQIFTISGIVQDGSSPTVYTSADHLKNLGATEFSQAKIEVVSRTNVELMRKQIENLGFKTQYVGDTVQQIEQIFSIFKIILGSFGLIALVVASLGMFNTLTISLLERIKEVALMKMLGMRKRDVASVFITEAVTLGIVGGIFGVAFGIIDGKIINSVLNYFAVRSGGEKITVFSYPVWFLLAMFGFAFLVGFITGLYPARRASKVNALDVLRYE